MEWLKPKKNFKQVITEYGYPFISKEVSDRVDGAKKYLKNLIDRRTDRQTDDTLCNPYGRHARDRQTDRQGKPKIQSTSDGEFP